MSFKFIVIAILGVSVGAIYLTREPGAVGETAESAVEAPAQEAGTVARIMAMFTGSQSSKETADPPQVIRGGGAIHGGYGKRFVSAPER